LFCKLVGFVDLEIGCRGVVENQIDIESQQVGGTQEHVSFYLV
jgi:hypothetical protein